MYSITLKVGFLLGIVTQCLGKNNYVAVLVSIEAIESIGDIIMDFRDLKLIGRERTLNGTIYINEDTDNITVTFEMFIFRDGNWTQLPYAAKDITACQFYQQFFIAYFSPQSLNTNFPPMGKDYCPLRKGEYWIIEEIPNTDKWVSFMRRGLVKLRFEGFKNGKSIGGFIGVANIIDRES